MNLKYNMNYTIKKKHMKYIIRMEYNLPTCNKPDWIMKICNWSKSLYKTTKKTTALKSF